MIVDLEAGGRRRDVDVRREGDRWLVTLDGRQVAAHVIEIGGRWSLLLGPPEGGPDTNTDAVGPAGVGRLDTLRSHEVSIDAGSGGELLVHVDGHSVPVASAGLQGRRRRADAGGEAGSARPDEIVSPMPGRIVRVLVRPGDRVGPGQGLVIVEAMKMENELRAARAGTVTDVRVTEGMSVEARAVLVVLG